MLHLSWEHKHLINGLLCLAILIRIILLFSLPQLSDDFYRFLWDGHLIKSGINPINELPSVLIEGSMSDYYLDGLYPFLNSPDYFTVYPTFSQLVFYVSSLFGGMDIHSSILIMKSILLIFEIGTIVLCLRLLSKLNLSKKYALIYALNPLVIIEIMGNVHFEGIMLFFFLSAIYLLLVNRHFASAIGFSLSVASKLLPLMFIPAFYIYIKRQKRQAFKYVFIVAALVALLTSPFLYGLNYANFLSSLNLYFQKFEFNASVYYLIRNFFHLITGYNQIYLIGPSLALIAVLLIVRQAIKTEMADIQSLIDICLLSFCTYLFLATTVHPWYLILPIGLSVFIPRIWLLVWSFFVVFSYGHYDQGFLIGSDILIFIEYFIVLVVWYIEKKYPLLGKEAGIDI